MYQINELAKIVGISVRTLQHYDSINLLTPTTRDANHYRLYDEESINTLQQILFFKTLGFSLKSIKELLSAPGYNQLQSLQLQKRMIEAKVQQYETMIHTINQTIKHYKEEYTMSTEEKFNGLHFDNNSFEQEAREKFGNQAINSSKEKMANWGNEKLQQLWNTQFTKLATIRNENPRSYTAQQAIKEFHLFLNTYFGSYTKQSIAGLGLLYVNDERFRNNMEPFGEGVTDFLSAAMQYYGHQ